MANGNRPDRDVFAQRGVPHVESHHQGSLLKDWRVQGLIDLGILAGFLVGLLVFGEPWHLPPDWGDVPTWLLTAGAAITAWYAMRAYSEQHREVTAIEQQVKDGQDLAQQQARLLEVQGEQLDTQRQQLAEQRDVNERQSKVLELQAEDLRESILERKREAERTAKRDELLDKQIAEAEQRSLTYERRQAERVDLQPSIYRTMPFSLVDHAAAWGFTGLASRMVAGPSCRMFLSPGLLTRYALCRPRLMARGQVRCLRRD